MSEPHDLYPKCPYPYGRRDANEWWEGYFRLAIAERRVVEERRAAEQRAAERDHYGHNFSTPSRDCDCGMRYSTFRDATDDERWRDRKKFACPVPAGAVFFLECYRYGGLYDAMVGAGKQVPVASYGPSDWLTLVWLRARVGGDFARAEIIPFDPKAADPLPEHRWPAEYRPRPKGRL